MRLSDAVLIADERSEPASLNRLHRRAERQLDNARMSANFDSTGDRRAVLDFGHGAVEQPRRSLQAVVGRAVEIGPRADDRDRRPSLEVAEAPRCGDGVRPLFLLSQEGLGKERKVVFDGKQNRTVDREMGPAEDPSPALSAVSFGGSSAGVCGWLPR